MDVVHLLRRKVAERLRDLLDLLDDSGKILPRVLRDMEKTLRRAAAREHRALSLLRSVRREAALAADLLRDLAGPDARINLEQAEARRARLAGWLAEAETAYAKARDARAKAAAELSALRRLLWAGSVETETTRHPAEEDALHRHGRQLERLWNAVNRLEERMAQAEAEVETAMETAPHPENESETGPEWSAGPAPA